MSRREQAKDSRRTRIVNAARTLIQETGDSGFQMRALADAAGLSLVTLYNLFGSKQAIMIALLDDDVRKYEGQLLRLRGDELDRFFSAIALARRLWARDPNIYRIILAAAYQDGGREFRATFRAPRRAFWQRLVANAVRAGVLHDHVPVEPYASNLAYIFLSAILEWVSGEITLQEMEVRAQYGFALTLLPMATPAYVQRVQRKLEEYTAAVRRWERPIIDQPQDAAQDSSTRRAAGSRAGRTRAAEARTAGTRVVKSVANKGEKARAKAPRGT